MPAPGIDLPAREKLLRVSIQDLKMSTASRGPILITSLGVLILSCMDAAMKSVSGAYPLAEVIGLRYAAGTVVSLAVFRTAGNVLPGQAALKRNFFRAIVVLLTAGSFFTAIARLPLVEAIALTFLAPLFTAVLGRLLLGEPIAPRIAVGIAFGLLGVGIIGAGQGFDKSHARDLTGVGAALACAFFYALSNVLMRRQSRVDSSTTIVMLSNVFVFCLASPAMVAGWQPPSLFHAAVFALAGVLGTAGHLCLAWSYAKAPAGTLGVLEYTAFVWASALGFVLFAEVPSASTTIGAAVIIAACFVSTWRRSRSESQPVTPPV